MYNFLLGGWVARPSVFYFLFCAVALSSLVALSHSVSVVLSLGFVLAYTYSSNLPRFVARVLLRFSWLPLPVRGMPSISALLWLVYLTRQNHALHIYALLIYEVA